jgi:hypothetical protein
MRLQDTDMETGIAGAGMLRSGCGGHQDRADRADREKNSSPVWTDFHIFIV